MHTPSYYSILITLFFWFCFSWMVYRMLIQIHPFYNQRIIRYGYWCISIFSLAVFYWLRWRGGITDPFIYILYGVYTWIIGQGMMFFSLLLVFGLRRVLNRFSRPQVQRTNLSRRYFLQQVTAVVPVLTMGFTALTVYTTNHKLLVRRIRLPFVNLPAQLNGLKIVQISDTHIGPFFTMEKLEYMIKLIHGEQPDAVVITGDLIDDLALLEPTMRRLSEMHRSIPYGMYFCWGNHEYFRNQARIRNALRNSPITILENESRRIIDGENPFYLLGVDYPWARNLEEQGERRRRMIEKTTADVPASAFSVLLTHHPNFITEAFAANIPLTLAGHTHGGQIAIGGYAVLPFQYHFMSGLYQERSSYAYVNNGAGNWFPLRVGRPAEITVFTLVSNR
jgi:uncharacterized protein